MTSRCAAAAAAALALLVTCACFEDGRMRSEQTYPGEDPMRNVAQSESVIVDLERAALEQFGRGEIDGPLALCDDRITYFAPYVPARIEGREALAAVYEEARGKPQYARFEMVGPAVQALGDTAILTYVVATDGAPGSASTATRWKVTAVYHRFDDRWRVVHAHLALHSGTTPSDLEFAAPPVDLERLGDPVLRELLALEDAAMERWRRGDPWGFWELSASEVTYFDPETDGRVEGADGLRGLYAAVEGKVLYDVSEYIAPKVQVFGEVAVLTYQYRSASIQGDGSVTQNTRWNTTEVFARIDGRWRIVHTHWSYARPLVG